jgi:hypothetical protein
MSHVTSQVMIEELMSKFKLDTLIAFESFAARLVFIERDINGIIMAGYWNLAKKENLSGFFRTKFIVKNLDENVGWSEKMLDAFDEQGYVISPLPDGAESIISRLIVVMKQKQPSLKGLKEVSAEFGNSFRKKDLDREYFNRDVSGKWIKVDPPEPSRRSLREISPWKLGF